MHAWIIHSFVLNKLQGLIFNEHLFINKSLFTWPSLDNQDPSSSTAPPAYFTGYSNPALIQEPPHDETHDKEKNSNKESVPAASDMEGQTKDQSAGHALKVYPSRYYILMLYSAVLMFQVPLFSFSLWMLQAK